MNFRELHACAGRILHGGYRQVLRASLLYPSVWLVLWVSPCILAAVLIGAGILTPRALLLGSVPLWVLIAALWAVLRFCILLPIRCGTWSWFTGRSGLARAQERPVFFRNFRSYMQGVRYFSCIWLFRLGAALPCALGLLGADHAFRAGIGQPEGILELFLTAQCLCLAAAGAVYYADFCIGAAAVPFLFTEHPDGSPIAELRRSRSILRGHHAQLLRLLIGYLPAALPAVTIPFLLPRLMMEYTLFLQICIREYEEEAHAHTAIYYEPAGAVQA